MHPERIVLIGYRGTGKTTVGRLLAEELRWHFADCDDAVEVAAGKSIAQIFADEGEAGFREREADMLSFLCSRERAVIATGGGAILRPANRDLLRSAGFVAWLTAPPETIWSRLKADSTTSQRRPNLTALGGVDEVRSLLAAREPNYRAVADFIADTDGPSPESVAATIFKAWTGSHSSRS